VRDDAGYELASYGEPSPHLAPSQVSFALNPINQILAISSTDGRVTVWDTTSDELVSSLPGSSDAYVQLEFDTEGKFLTTLDRAGVFKYWGVNEPAETVAVPGFHGCCFAISPDAARLAITIRPSTIGVFDLPALISSGKRSTAELFTVDLTLGGGAELFGQRPIVVDVEFSEDGELVAIAGGESIGTGQLRVFRADTGQPVQNLDSSSVSYLALASNGAGTALASAGSDGTVVLREASSGALLRTLSGHTGPANQVVFSEDDTRIATAGQDGTAKIWDSITGTELLTLFVATGGATDVAFSADGSRLYASGEDGVVRVFLLDLGELIELAEARLTRTLTTDECLRYLHVTRCPVGR
jgi:WD40 repeat protein